MAGRWGGEEFLIVCNDTIAQAAVLAEKPRAALERHPIDVVGPNTASLGVCSYRIGDNIKTMMVRADVAFYRAKDSGRNGVEVEGPIRMMDPTSPNDAQNGPTHLVLSLQAAPLSITWPCTVALRRSCEF